MPAKKPMCFSRRESSWTQHEPNGAWFEHAYNIFKCGEERLAMCQMAHIDAPECPGKCARAKQGGQNA